MCWSANGEEPELFKDEERREEDERRNVETIVARELDEPERSHDREREPIQA
jgi:hypothetical protein